MQVILSCLVCAFLGIYIVFAILNTLIGCNNLDLTAECLTPIPYDGYIIVAKQK